MDKTLMQQEMEGRIKSAVELTATRDLFVRAQGLDQSIEKTKAALAADQAAHEKAKEKLADLQARKYASLGKTLERISGAMTRLLPQGSAIISYDDEGATLFIGWQHPNGTRIAHSGLSGGERVAFDTALAHALGANILVGEFAELDDSRLYEALERFAASVRPDAQAIVLSCHTPSSVPPGWKVVSL